MRTKIELKGVYKVYDGKDCDNIPYWAILVVTDNQAWISDFTIHSHLASSTMKEVVLNDDEDLFTKLGIINYKSLV